ncbi:hypothetical protein FCU45_09030 [Sulfurimonas crateris]|uniref:Uncharacterized protein n=1 Tax=Sulfurimonas crateris TaxID=2574727 RepID=A0A4U2Z6H3_9BACT|nr:hypothetical protein [Sulfurimonas crateris]TKI69092.1 hypothetical protein FCU45_09030 [Sulfurimonas crateris]
MKKTSLSSLAILLSLLFVPNSLKAVCCGCAIVQAMMWELNATVHKSVEAMDEALALDFNITVMADSNISKQEALKREEELKKSIMISKEIVGCYEEINFILEQTTSIEAVTKSVELINEFDAVEEETER